MKRLISAVIIAALCIGLCLCLTGCDRPSVAVSSVLEIDEKFAGARTVEVAFPLSVDIDKIKDSIIADDPTKDVSGAEFSYIGVEEDGYYFQLKISFLSREEYETAVSSLIGRTAASFYSNKDTYLTKGVRMAENFDVSELVSWIVRDTHAESSTKNIRFDYSRNTAEIGNRSFETDSTISINDCDGSAVNSIGIKTYNDKEDSYNRTITFSVPNDTYVKDKEAIESYFLANTASDAKYSGWSAEGTNMIYTVIYENLDLASMTEYTSMLLDTDNVSIFYGDRDNSSTPLAEGLTFEESLDTFSFIGSNSSFPKLEYSYSLPLNTTYGDGTVFENGHWTSAGSWTDGMYSVELNSGAAQVRIPDGIQYNITGINFRLKSLGDSKFSRSTDFLYDKNTGSAARSYAESYFTQKGENVTTFEEDNSLVCRVTNEGTTEEITESLVKLFGSGNFITYKQDEGLFALTVKTNLTDYVNLDSMLSADNAAVPMTYYVSSDGGENIVSVSVDGAETAYTDNNASSLPVNGGVATVEYRGNIPITVNIIIYILVGAALIALTAFIAVKLLKPKKKKRVPDPLNNPEAVYETEDTQAEESSDEDTSAANPLTQTTTFSIFELGALSRNKKYVEEINKDIEKRMHAQNIEDQKHDIRAKELEQMSKLVYGDEKKEETDGKGEDEQNV